MDSPSSTPSLLFTTDPTFLNPRDYFYHLGPRQMNPRQVEARCQLEFARINQIAATHTIVGSLLTHPNVLMEMRRHVCYYRMADILT